MRVCVSLKVGGQPVDDRFRISSRRPETWLKIQTIVASDIHSSERCLQAAFDLDMQEACSAC